ncbi:uncharacterized protein LOC123864467 isoform X3 [Maniola jurtina]|uniref:uncharacterized protein LOC123864467 isoform X2 n=1 Tax=Maniola jurtina TaxID=191418 RepID=UPI001E68DBDB|nr:uncharacterized protein LOC123864467 isoform X2 [Maniola jurtina]XP_045760889.1 uncharacterized protein LOC123864467 isoform X3 [Maniola jurtina]
MTFSLPFQIMASTTMGELCLRPVSPEQEGFFSRIIQIIEDTYPDDWRSWEIQDLSYSDLFGEKISSRIEAKLRFAIPTAEMAMAYCPNDASLSEKKYRLIKRKLLEWPLGRALLYSPHSIMEKIHDKSYEDFIKTVKLLKPRLTARDEASTSECTLRKRGSTSPISLRGNKTPRYESSEPNRVPVTDSFMAKMMDLLTKQWTSDNNVSPKTPSPGDLARYLINLYNVKKLAPRTILVHKSAISTFTKPCNTSPLSDHPLVKKTIKAILLKNPPKRCSYIWNVADLVNWMGQRKIEDSSLFQISQHVATLLLLATGRRVHDLTLLHIDAEHCQITREQIIFWPSFGSKTDNANYRQSGWCLSKSDKTTFDLCYWIPKLINKSEQRRKADPTLTNLFITTRNRVKAASRSVITGWLRLILKDAKIKGSPGSFRSAVATDNWVNKNLDIDEVLRKGNWRSSSTFLKHYFKEVEARTRNVIANQAMSDLFFTI